MYMTRQLRNSGAASQCVAVCCSVLQYTVMYCSYVTSDSMQPLRNNVIALQYAAVAVAQRPRRIHTDALRYTATR